MFEKKSVVIKDGKKLSFDYVPKVLVGREEQMDRLSMIFRSVVEDGRSESAFLTGSVGTGKTATAKRFVADMMEYAARNNIQMDSIVVNCRQKGTETGVIFQCLKHYDPGFPDRGFSPSEMLRMLRGQIEKSKKRLIIIMDEVDVLLKKGPVDLIYQLSRFSEENIGISASVSMILISQEYVIDRLDDATLSSFKRANTVRFGRYTEAQLKDIVSARVDEALMPGAIRPDAVSLIAEISSELGDARFAIDMLDKAARMAEGREDGRINAEDVRSVNEFVFSIVNEPKLESLSKNEMVTLLAISRAIKTNSYIALPTVEKTYAVVCEEYDMEPRKHTQFWSYVDSLEKKNLITSNVRMDETTGGRTKYISVPDIPSKVLSKKLEAILDSSSRDYYE